MGQENKAGSLTGQDTGSQGWLYNGSGKKVIRAGCISQETGSQG